MRTAEDVYARRLIAKNPVQRRIREDLREGPRLKGGRGGERTCVQNGVGCVSWCGGGGGADHRSRGVDAVKGAGGEDFGEVVGEDAV